MTVDYEVVRGNMVWFQVWSPEGKIFCTTGGHVDASLSGCVNDSMTAANWVKAYAMLEEIIAHGFDDCTDSECDICNH